MVVHLLRKLFCLAMIGSICAAMPVSAQQWSERENNIYDYAFSYGSLSTLCTLFVSGQLAGDTFRVYVEIAKSSVNPGNYKTIVESFSGDKDFMKKCLPYIK